MVNVCFNNFVILNAVKYLVKDSRIISEIPLSIRNDSRVFNYSTTSTHILN